MTEAEAFTAPEILPCHDPAPLADTLADAFALDPVMNHLFPNASLYRQYFELMGRNLFARHQLMFSDADHRAAALWLPPGVAFDLPIGAQALGFILRQAVHGGWRGPSRLLRRLDEVRGALEQQHPEQAHYYLHAIGCRAAFQGRGLGSALLKPMLARCDAERMPAYLESSRAENLPLYERHGFAVRAEINLRDGGPTLWPMWREPRGV